MSNPANISGGWKSNTKNKRKLSFLPLSRRSDFQKPTGIKKDIYAETEVGTMRILHYSLGFPPFRSGGLTKYCFDLMQAQVRQGSTVALLWPGKTSLKTRIKKGSSVKGVESYELLRPLPVPLDQGILKVEAFTAPRKEKIFDRFFESGKFDIMHIHTLMGLPAELLNAAKKRNVKLLFTAHDYFGLCPKVTYFKNGQPCGELHCESCFNCNKTALSITKISLLQSTLYRKLRSVRFMRFLRRKSRDRFFASRKVPPSKKKAAPYLRLRAYYLDMLSAMDCIHFNSSVTENVYRHFLKVENGVVIAISHLGIQDNRAEREFDFSHIRLAYMGPIKEFKGFFLLKDALDRLWRERITNFELRIYDQTDLKAPYLNPKPKYDYKDLPNIFQDTDLLIVPSLWYETFGFTALEALSYGVPVLISERAGAKDLVKEKAVFRVNDLAECLRSILKNEDGFLAKANREILTMKLPFSESHYREISDLYQNLIGRKEGAK